jgi:hypothetical protein
VATGPVCTCAKNLAPIGIFFKFIVLVIYIYLCSYTYQFPISTCYGVYLDKNTLRDLPHVHWHEVLRLSCPPPSQTPFPVQYAIHILPGYCTFTFPMDIYSHFHNYCCLTGSSPRLLPVGSSQLDPVCVVLCKVSISPSSKSQSSPALSGSASSVPIVPLCAVLGAIT